MIVGVVISAFVGCIACFIGFGGQRRRRAMAATPTVRCAQLRQVAGVHEPVPCEVKGTVEPANGQLNALLTGAPCVWYSVTVRRHFEQEQHANDGSIRRETRTEIVMSQSSAEPFCVRDATGTAWVHPGDAKATGMTATASSFEPYRPGMAMAPPPGSFAERAHALGIRLLAGESPSTRGYTYEELVLRVGDAVYVLGGAVRDERGNAWIQRPADGPYLISTKSEEELTRNAKAQLYAGYGVAAIAFGVAVILGAASLLG